MTPSQDALEADSFIVLEEETAHRLDRLLVHRFPSYSRTYFQYLIEEGYVLLNGQVCKKRTKPQKDDEIEICFQWTPEISLAPENIPLTIVYEDEDLIAINKPAGMVVHPACGHPSGTFVNALLHHCQTFHCKDPIRPGIVHRLDKGTTGLLIAAKNPKAHQKLVEAFASRSIQKYYLAITVGRPPEGLIDAPIGRDPIHRKQMAICFEKGKEAKSECRILATSQPLSLVEVRLITGRTHQIRVHLKHHGTPVLGDPVYGSPSANKKFDRHEQLLHAHRLSLIHPISGAPLHLVAPPPASFFQIGPISLRVD